MSSDTSASTKTMCRELRTAAALCVFFVMCLALSVWQGAAHAAGTEEPVSVVKEESIAEGVKAVIEDAKALMLAPLNMDRYDAMKLGGAVALVGGLIAADHPIQNFVDHHTSSKGRDVGNQISNWLGPGPLLGYNAAAIAIGVASESYGGSSKLKEAGLVSLEAEGFAIVAVSALKLVTGRARPESNEGATHFRPFTGLNGSFVSGHAAASFAVATVFAERYEGVGWIAYPLAIAVSASRIYTDKHFASDVVAGSLIGYGLGHFINRQHSGDPTDWQIRPMVMDGGLGGGIMIGRRF